MEKNDESNGTAENSDAEAPPSLAGAIFFLLAAVFGLLAGLNALFHFGPPFVFGVVAGISALIGITLVKQ